MRKSLIDYQLSVYLTASLKNTMFKLTIIYIVIISSLIFNNCSNKQIDNSAFSNKKIIVKYYNIERDTAEHRRSANLARDNNSALNDNKKDSPKTTNKDKIMLGRVPYADVREMYEKHLPLIKYLESKTGKSIELKYYSSYSAMIKGILKGEIQLAWMGPVSYVIAADKMKAAGKYFTPLVKPQRRNTTYLHSEIIVRKDSGYKTIKDLRADKFAYLDLKSTAGYILPTAMLANAGVKISNVSDSNFVRHFGNVVKSVYLGKFDAGATFDGAYRQYLTPAEQSEIRVLAVSESVPFEPICLVANSTPATAEIDKLRGYFLSITDKVILENLEVQKFMPASIAEYATLSKLVRKVYTINEKILE